MIGVWATGRLAWLKNFNVVIFSNIINVVNVKLCIVVLLIALLPVHTIFLGCDHIRRSQQCQTVSTENYIFFFV